MSESGTALPVRWRAHEFRALIAGVTVRVYRDDAGGWTWLSMGHSGLWGRQLWRNAAAAKADAVRTLKTSS